MIVKDYAEEIVGEFRKALRADNRSWEAECKECARICVKRIIKSEVGAYKDFYGRVLKEVDNINFV